DCQLVVRVEDKDKLVGTTELGESRIDLRELDLLAGWLEGNGGQRSAGAGGESTVRLSRFIDIFKAEEKGAVLLGLSFLPTSQRITVHITQCNRLAKTADSAVHNKAVVRLFLLNESGRVLKKRKTAPFDPNGGRVELDELFHLDVDIERWDRCVILIVLSRIISPAVGEATTTEAVRSPPVYQHSGHVALGKRVLGHAERIHWNSAFQSPRRVISQWHGLH
ncbi:putative synaptotagmin 57, partial [Daphnia pulex]